mgnify:CR=1 FL=1
MRVGVRLSTREVLIALIKRFLKENGYHYLTYRSFRRWLYRNRIRLEWHTVERELRRMAEEGLLERIYIRKGVRFYPTERLLEG